MVDLLEKHSLLNYIGYHLENLTFFTVHIHFNFFKQSPMHLMQKFNHSID